MLHLTTHEKFIMCSLAQRKKWISIVFFKEYDTITLFMAENGIKREPPNSHQINERRGIKL